MDTTDVAHTQLSKYLCHVYCLIFYFCVLRNPIAKDTARVHIGVMSRETTEAHEQWLLLATEWLDQTLYAFELLGLGKIYV